MHKFVPLLFLLIFLPVFLALGVALFRWLWNITMPQVFGLREIVFWQAFRLLLLAGFLFGGVKYASNHQANQRLADIDSKLNSVAHNLDTVTEHLAKQP